MDVETRVEILSRETTALRREILMMKSLINRQHLMLKDLAAMAPKQSDPRGRFPISSQEALDDFEKWLNEENRTAVISEMHYIIDPIGLRKGLNRIISERLIMDYNLCGSQNMKRLKNYTNFLDVLYKATYKENRHEDDFYGNLRTAIRLIKNRTFKKAFDEKKRMKKEDIFYDMK